MKKTFSLKKLYFTLISIAGIIGIVFGYGTFIYSMINNAIISDDEYIAGSYSYEIKDCENPYTRPEGEAPKTPAEIQKCKDDARTTILQRRGYDKKISIINGLVRGTLFLILFVSHFPFMIRKEK